VLRHERHRLRLDALRLHVPNDLVWHFPQHFLREEADVALVVVEDHELDYVSGGSPAPRVSQNHIVAVELHHVGEIRGSDAYYDDA